MTGYTVAVVGTGVDGFTVLGSNRERSTPSVVLIANEPRAYREALASALQELRPNLDIRSVIPEELEHTMKHTSVHFVVCSNFSSALATGTVTWLVLYPKGARLVVHGRQDEHVITGDVDLKQIAAEIDRASSLDCTV